MICLFVATGSEARAARRAASGAQNTGHGNEEIRANSRARVVVTGVGSQAAESAVKSVLAGTPGARPAAVLVAGTCGALSASLPEGAIVTYAQCLFAGASGVERITANAELTGQMVRALGLAGMEPQSVCGITSPEVAATRQGKNRLAATGASVVDMESYVILSAARQMGVPAVVLRVVSDGVDRELPDFTRAILPDGRLDRFAAAVIAARAPLATTRLMLAQRRALRNLSLALEAVLGSNCWPDAG